jgi:hypothetical protein
MEPHPDDERLPAPTEPEQDAEAWDRQFEDDVAAGRLDWLKSEVGLDRERNRLTNR